MDAFTHLSVLLSIILGLAITQLLLGFGRLIQHRAAVRFYMPPIAWAVILVLICMQYWWALFGLRSHATWTFVAFFIVTVQTIFVYLLTALVLPDIDGVRAVDLRTHYFRQAPWFGGCALAATIASIARDVALDGRLPRTANLIFHIVFMLAAALMIVVRREWLHRVLPALLGVWFVAYISMLFTRIA